MTTPEEKAEMMRHLHQSDIRQAREWLETLAKRRADEAREMTKFLERFDWAVEDETKPKAERKGYDTITSVLASAVHLAAQAGSNDRLDLAVNYAAALMQSKV